IYGRSEPSRAILYWLGIGMVLAIVLDLMSIYRHYKIYHFYVNDVPLTSFQEKLFTYQPNIILAISLTNMIIGTVIYFTKITYTPLGILMLCCLIWSYLRWGLMV